MSRWQPRATGPGLWLCWPCFDHVSNHETWRTEYWISPPGYRSKGGVCERDSNHYVGAGDRAAKVTVDANLE